MSKDAANRALREAKYAARMSKVAAPPRPVKPSAAADQAAPVAGSRPAPATAPAASTAGDELCGHRSMNGRLCTREAGHAAKSHRYS